jgi:thiol-disulfide isomerase/thioredoxin
MPRHSIGLSLFGDRRHGGPPPLPFEGHLPGFDGATGWLNSAPLSNADLRGKVVLVDFWTYTCINWLRTLAYVRAWAAKYVDRGLVVVGVHTPEFSFERDVVNVRRAVETMRIGYPVALDGDYGVWRDFGNHYWPAVYIADGDGRIRYHHFGEGEYEQTERVVQQLLGVEDGLVEVEPQGFEVQADWANLMSPETYLGYEQGRNFGSPGGAHFDEPRDYSAPSVLMLNRWALAGNWTITGGAASLNEAGGRIAFRFHARDVNVVLLGETAPFRVLVDGDPPGDDHGGDVDEEGRGTVREPRLYQLIRQRGPIVDRTLEIAIDSPGVEAYVFTFG